MKQQTFDTMSEAFDFCREVDRPIVLKIFPPTHNFKLIEIFPSGSFREMRQSNTRARIVHAVTNYEHPDKLAGRA